MSDMGDAVETTDAPAEEENPVTDNGDIGGPEIAKPDWYVSEGVLGTGDAPEGFRTDKYNNLAEQAKAYNELESKYGSFTGAPKEGKYELNVSEELSERGFQIQDDDPMYDKAMEFAKNSEMNQKGFDEMVDLYGDIKSYEAELKSKADEDYRTEQTRLIGNDAQEQLKDMFDWGKQNLSPSEYKHLDSMEFSAGNVKLIQSLIAKSQDNMSPDDSTAIVEDLKAKLDSMRFEKDQYGNRRLASDTQFAGEYEMIKIELQRIENGKS